MNKDKLRQELNMSVKGCRNGEQVAHLLWQLEKESAFGLKIETLYLFTENYYELKNWVKDTFAKRFKYINSIEGQTAKLVVKKAQKQELKLLKQVWKGLEKFERDFMRVYSVSLSDTQYQMSYNNIKVANND